MSSLQLHPLGESMFLHRQLPAMGNSSRKNLEKVNLGEEISSAFPSPLLVPANLIDLMLDLSGSLFSITQRLRWHRLLASIANVFHPVGRTMLP